MIEQLTFIEELEKVKKHKHCPQMINAIDANNSNLINAELI